MHARIDFIPSRFPKALRVVSFHPSRHASPRVFGTNKEHGWGRVKSPARGESVAALRCSFYSV